MRKYRSINGVSAWKTQQPLTSAACVALMVLGISSSMQELGPESRHIKVESFDLGL